MSRTWAAAVVVVVIALVACSIGVYRINFGEPLFEHFVRDVLTQKPTNVEELFPYLIKRYPGEPYHSKGVEFFREKMLSEMAPFDPAIDEGRSMIRINVGEGKRRYRAILTDRRRDPGSMSTPLRPYYVFD